MSFESLLHADFKNIIYSTIFDLIFQFLSHLLEGVFWDFVDSMKHFRVVIEPIVKSGANEVHFIADFDSNFMVWSILEPEI